MITPELIQKTAAFILIVGSLTYGAIALYRGLKALRDRNKP